MHPPPPPTTKRAVLKGLAELANMTIWVFALLVQENAIKLVLTHYSLSGGLHRQEKRSLNRSEALVLLWRIFLPKH